MHAQAHSAAATPFYAYTAGMLERALSCEYLRFSLCPHEYRSNGSTFSYGFYLLAPLAAKNYSRFKPAISFPGGYSIAYFRQEAVR